VFVSGAREELVTSYEQMMRTLEVGTAHRTTAATKMNQTSSRSHAIFTVLIQHTIYSHGLVSIEDPENVSITTSQSNTPNASTNRLALLESVGSPSIDSDALTNGSSVTSPSGDENVDPNAGDMESTGG
jgi:hypothetical protein